MLRTRMNGALQVRIRAGMNSATSCVAVLVLLSAASGGCGGGSSVAGADAATDSGKVTAQDSRPHEDSSPGRASDGSTQEETGSHVDAGASDGSLMIEDSSSQCGDAGSDAGAACSPSTGTDTLDLACASLNLAVMAHGSATDVVLTGYLEALTLGDAGSPSCLAVDGVDIVTGAVGSTLVMQLEGGASLAPPTPGLYYYGENANSLSPPTLGHASTVASALQASCATSEPSSRFNSYGVVIHGRTNGGTFTAACGKAATPTAWPPLALTCNTNLDEPPTHTDVQLVMVGPVTQVSLFADALHGPGGAITSLASNVYIIPQQDQGDTSPPLPSGNTTGWQAQEQETGLLCAPNGLDTSLSLFAPLPALCDSNVNYPAVFIARATGTGGRGAFSAEMFFSTPCFNP